MPSVDKVAINYHVNIGLGNDMSVKSHQAISGTRVDNDSKEQWCHYVTLTFIKQPYKRNLYWSM